MEKIFWEVKPAVIFTKYRSIRRTEISPGIFSYENVINKEIRKSGSIRAGLSENTSYRLLMA